MKLKKNLRRFEKRLEDVVYVTGKSKEVVGLYWLDVGRRKIEEMMQRGEEKLGWKKVKIE